MYKYKRRELMTYRRISSKKDENKLQEDVEHKRLTLMYGAALKQLETKIEVINNEFKTLHKYNPIEHVTSRIKSKESINKNLQKKGLEVNTRKSSKNNK